MNVTFRPVRSPSSRDMATFLVAHVSELPDQRPI
jgi:hypothetical protein